MMREIFEKNVRTIKDKILINSNFNYDRINSLFSNLSSLSLLELMNLKKNYQSLNYSTVDINIQIQKIISYPIYLILMTIFSSVIMLNSKKYTNSTLKISLGLFFCVIIYYLNNLFNVLDQPKLIIFVDLDTIIIINILTSLMTYNVNEKINCLKYYYTYYKFIFFINLNLRII